ncbi:hypothetical protein Hypma_012349 [Hypsizygus marmoreus]|uniref:DUF5648 domain-containing protein n=1 Tax=Hypsizygus marmoreus TaxID=39966 RepID=A0A369KEH9_HYPMA|nr:hypothetical protein Hypma_012349 [Hypsizygus marmoreus]
MQLKFFMLAAIFGCAIASPVLEGADINARGLDVEGADFAARDFDLEMRAPQGGATPTGGSSQPTGSSQPNVQGGNPFFRGCGNRRDAVPFFRKNFPSFRVSVIIGFFFRTRKSGTVALFVLFNRRTGDYIYTLSTRERGIGPSHGYQFQGVAGWVYPDDRCGGFPLYRMWNTRTRKHFYTARVSERDQALRTGYEIEGITGFIYQN